MLLRCISSIVLKIVAIGAISLISSLKGEKKNTQTKKFDIPDILKGTIAIFSILQHSQLGTQLSLSSSDKRVHKREQNTKVLADLAVSDY